MSTNNVIFLEVLEWLDQSGNEVCHRLPEKGSGEFKLGAQAIVRQNQAAVFYSQGVACDALGPGRHTISTLNIPILTKLLSLPWGFTSPIRAEIYFVNMKVFTSLKWGTRDPVAFRDKELGLVRLRAHGIFNIQINQPVLFVNSLVGTKPSFFIDELEEYLSQVIISRLNDYLGEQLDTLLDLPSQYTEFAEGLSRELVRDFSNYGIALKDLFINAITPPAEVQAAIDDRTRLELLGGNLPDLVKMKAAMALEKSSQGQSMAQGGIGMGLGLMIPGLLGSMGLFGSTNPPPNGGPAPPDKTTQKCPECGADINGDARFCPNCGHQILVYRRCAKCGKNLTPKASFCPSCGTPAGSEPLPQKCPHCGAENLPQASFCNQCGKPIR